MKSENTNPWRTIARPEAHANIKAHRVDPQLRWDIYWAVDENGNYLLVLQHSRTVRPTVRMPKLLGVEVERRSPASNPNDLLVIKLRDWDEKELFYRLCMDIISATAMAETEDEAIKRFIGRTWQWHRLLKNRDNRKLTNDEQKGLIGELWFLESHLFPTIGIAKAVASWEGPLGASKDFDIGKTCVEVKTRKSSAKHQIAIASEHQLDSSSMETLFLYVIDIALGLDKSRESFTIAEIARRILSRIQKQDPATVDLFEERLYALGFDWNDDYNDNRWLVGKEHLFELTEDFPRIVPGMYPRGVVNVRYSISLADCESFVRKFDTLYRLIEGGNDAA